MHRTLLIEERRLNGVILERHVKVTTRVISVLRNCWGKVAFLQEVEESKGSENRMEYNISKPLFLKMGPSQLLHENHRRRFLKFRLLSPIPDPPNQNVYYQGLRV